MSVDLLVLDDERMEAHVAGPGHPERPERLRAIREALRASFSSSDRVR